MFELKLDEATLERLDEVLAFTGSILKDTKCPMPVKKLLDVAVEEAYVNIVHYAYVPEIGPAVVCVEKKEGLGIEITFIDWGVPYNPLARPDPDVTLSAKERQIGGLGIYMVKKAMDKMDYKRENGMNVLTIFKGFEAVG